MGLTRERRERPRELAVMTDLQKEFKQQDVIQNHDFPPEATKMKGLLLQKNSNPVIFEK
jgi:hypothetical protein